MTSLGIESLDAIVASRLGPGKAGRPLFVIAYGPPASGKSTVLGALSEEISASYPEYSHFGNRVDILVDDIIEVVDRYKIYIAPVAEMIRDVARRGSSADGMKAIKASVGKLKAIIQEDVETLRIASSWANLSTVDEGQAAAIQSAMRHLKGAVAIDDGINGVLKVVNASSRTRDELKNAISRLSSAIYFSFRPQANVINDVLLDRALLQRSNVITFETTAGSEYSLQWLIGLVDRVHRMNYDVIVVYPLVGVDSLVRRAFTRSAQSGRLIGSEALSAAATSSQDLLPKLAPMVDGVYVMDNSTDGKDPILLYKSVTRHEFSCSGPICLPKQELVKNDGRLKALIRTKVITSTDLIKFLRG